MRYSCLLANPRNGIQDRLSCSIWQISFGEQVGCCDIIALFHFHRWNLLHFALVIEVHASRWSVHQALLTKCEPWLSEIRGITVELAVFYFDMSHGPCQITT